jgi:XTP/dITP diphosphohydrolase
MKIFLATKNNDKITEFQQILSNMNNVELVTSKDIDIPDVEETGSTFVENAILKARSAANFTSLPSIADDSGIEVDYLNGRPGVWSARYAGEDATNEMNNEKLLKELEGVSNDKRGACYRCVIVFMRFSNDPFPYIAQDSWKGRINDKYAGANGFGYDPIFFLPERNITSAELDPSDKHKISHRGKALNKFSNYFTDYVKNI